VAKSYLLVSGVARTVPHNLYLAVSGMYVMNFEDDQRINGFRSEVRGFLKTHWQSHLAGDEMRYPNPKAFRAGVDLLKKGGWLAPNWPKRWGGAELQPIEGYVLEQELIGAGFPLIDRLAFDLAAPVIYTFGSMEQKNRYLPKMLSGEEFWCQGFSEAESGSDVSSLRTSATRDGSHYVVEGRKIWTTNAHFADMMFALVKVKIGGRLQNGLTFILVDMHDPNVSVRPVTTIDGRPHVNEVTLNQVRVPAANVVGEIGRGWTNARFLLVNERVFLSQAPRTRNILERVKQWASVKRENGGAPLINEHGFRQRLAQMEIDLFALEFAVLRVLYASESNAVEGLAPALKLRGAELMQRVSELAVEILEDRAFILRAGLDKVAADPDLPKSRGVTFDVARDYLYSLAASIAGGTNEIQRNLIAGLALGL
jgi:alkylation response protein AidB-like acyl-CoA dehydrogenase